MLEQRHSHLITLTHSIFITLGGCSCLLLHLQELCFSPHFPAHVCHGPAHGNLVMGAVPRPHMIFSFFFGERGFCYWLHRRKSGLSLIWDVLGRRNKVQAKLCSEPDASLWGSRFISLARPWVRSVPEQINLRSCGHGPMKPHRPGYFLGHHNLSDYRRIKPQTCEVISGLGTFTLP